MHGQHGGAFIRPPSAFRRWVKASPCTAEDFPVAEGRYHLIISYACPWANRCVAVMRMKGLEHAISLSVVHPVWSRTRSDSVTDEHYGWQFKNAGDSPVPSAGGYGNFECDDVLTGNPDPVTGARFVRDIYEMSNAQPGGKFTVPILWCKETKSIVNNESEDITRMFNSEFDTIAKNPQINLFPDRLNSQILETNKWLYDTINNGVYKCGFAQDQKSYDDNIGPLFDSLGKCEKILSEQKYLVDNRLTESDIRLFMTLVRFDEVYLVYFKTNVKAIADYPNILNYCRDIYSIKEMKRSINMRHIKFHYYASHAKLNAFAVIPKGPNFLQLLEMPHDRNRFH